MWGYLGKRLLQIVITLFLFQAATYALLEAQPGDIADLLANNPDIPPSERERLRQELGLDRPPVERFFTYVINFYQGDLGASFQHYPRPVVDILRERLPHTLVLFLTATIVSFWSGFVLGKILAWRRGGWVEYTSTIGGVTLYTVFLPWFALMMIWLFAVQLGWLPTGKFLDPILWIGAPVRANPMFISMIQTALIGLAFSAVGVILSNYISPRYRGWARIAAILVPAAGVYLFWRGHELAPYVADISKHLILPVLTLTLVSFAGYMLLMRTSMLETLREDYILTARAKGMPDGAVRDKHAARNALLPVWTSLVFGIATAINGGIITETIFSWPGLGLTLLNGALVSDIPLVMGSLTVIGILVLLAHLVADVGYAFIDPRIRYH